MMNAGKRNYNGWILCPSKSFPGKFYYFNVLNGEAAWSLTESEQSSMGKGFIHHADKWHSYPEPETPPMDVAWPYRRPGGFGVGHQITPKFGQAVFPKYTPTEICPPVGMIWAPVPAAQLAPMPQMAPMSQMAAISSAQMAPMYLSCGETPSFSPKFWPQEPIFPSPPPRRSVWFDKSGQSSKNEQNLFGFGDGAKNWRNCDSQMLSRNVFAPKQATQVLEPQPSRMLGHQMRPQAEQNVNQRTINHNMFEQQPNSFQIDHQRFFKRPKQKTQLDSNLKIKRTVIFEPVQPVKQPLKRTLSEGSITDSQLFPSKSAFNPKDTFTGRNRAQNAPTFSQSLEQYKPNKNPKSSENVTAYDYQASSGTLDSRVEKTSLFRRPQANPFLKSRENISVFDIGHRDHSPTVSPKRKRSMSESVPKSDRTQNVHSKSFEDLPLREDHTICIDQENTLTKASEVSNGIQRDKLDKDDLRYTLLDKKRKKNTNGPKIETKNTAHKTEPVKKRVSFNLGVETAKSGEQEDLQNKMPEISNKHVSLRSLRELGLQHNARVGDWYIVVDMDVLTDHYDFLIDYIKADPACTLLVPDAVRREWESLARGEHRGRRGVLPARHLARKMAAPPPCVAFQDPDVEEMMNDLPVADSVINCCLLKADEDQHVVFITNDPVLQQKALDSGIFSFMLQEVKDGALADKTEVSFKLKKIQDFSVSEEKEKRQATTKSAVDSNPFAVRDKDHFPVNCFRKRLFDDPNVEILSKTQNLDSNTHTIQKNIVTSTLEGKLPPKNQRESEESSDLTLSSDVRREIQKLNLKKRPRTLEIRKNVSLKTFTFEKRTEAPNPAKKTDSRKETETQKQAEKRDFQKENQQENLSMASAIKKVERINAYTIEAQLKSFRVKNETVEERIVSRLDEWVCTFTQIMEESLTEILQDTNNGPLSPPPAPGTLEETIERAAETFSNSDRSAVQVLADRLTDMLRRTEVGKPKQNIPPDVFMKILGCGILLIKSLNYALTSPVLLEAEELLLGLVHSVEEPGGGDESLPVLTLSRHDADTPEGDFEYQRWNYVKKPPEVIEFLKRHYPAWRDYSEAEAQWPPENQQQNKIVRTCGKDLDLVTIDRTKSITMKHSHDQNGNAVKANTSANNTIKDYVQHTKDSVQHTKDSVKPTKDSAQNTKDSANIKESGPKLLKKLALASFGQAKDLVMKEIDVEQRERVNKNMENLIHDMIGPKTITKYYNLHSVIVDQNAKFANKTKTTEERNIVAQKDGPNVFRNSSNPPVMTVANEQNDKNNESTDVNRNVEKAAEERNSVVPKDGPKIIRNFSSLPAMTVKNTVANETSAKEKVDIDIEAKHGCTFGETKSGGPKIVRNIKLLDDFEKILNKNHENRPCALDLDALDYSAMDGDSERDRSLFSTDYDDDDSQRLVIDKNPNQKETSDDDQGQISDDRGQIDNDQGQTNQDQGQISDDRGQIDNDQGQTNQDQGQISDDRGQIDNDQGQTNQDQGQINDERGQSHKIGFQENLSGVEVTDKNNFNDVQAYASLKILLKELGVCFAETYEFVQTSMQEFIGIKSGEGMLGMGEKVARVQEHFACLVDKLECIIARESSKDDIERNRNHSQVIRKCVKQARLIMDQLKLLMKFAENDYATPSPSADSVILPYSDHAK